MKKTHILLTLSILTNVILICFLGRLINGLGGVEYIKTKYIHKSANQSINPGYYKTRVSIFESLPHHNKEIIFIGDSHIQYGEWNDLFENKIIHNRGIAGDDIQGVLLRINEELISKPSKIFIMIGINNLLNNNSTDQKIIRDYELLIAKIKGKSPDTRIYIHSILPTYGQVSTFNSHVSILNKELQRVSKKYHTTYINLYDSFLNTNGELYTKYSSDGTHLNGKGYLLWKDKIDLLVNE
jgi:lysophospholipase L1-like esterase